MSAAAGDAAGLLPNPYWLSLVEPQPAYWARIAAFTAAYAALFLLVDRRVSASEPGDRLRELSSPRGGARSDKVASAERSGLTAATNACSTVHAVGTSLASVWVCATLWQGDARGLAVPVWQWALAFSQGYFFADLVLYGTRRESWVLIHHSWMIISHHPIGEPLRYCALMGAGKCDLAVWLSATGYVAEISTVFLNIRWLQIKWLRKPSVWYTVNAVCLLVTYPAGRIFTVPAILIGSLWPHWDEYARRGVASLAVFTSVTYVLLGLMSGFFYSTLLAKGLRHAVMFTPPAASKEE